MPYVTIKMPPIYYQMSFDDIISGPIDVSKMVTPNVTSTRTHYREHLNDAFLEKFDFLDMVITLKRFNDRYSHLFDVDRHSLYDTFYIPKKSGGLREINAPLPELMNALRNLKSIFETKMFALYHTSAFAYVKGRSTIDAVKRHQKNESRWFAKFDFSNFFGSTTKEFVLLMFSEIFPFSEILKEQEGFEALSRALDLCFLDGGLPQGTPISPLITNVMMIPIDHRICNDLRHSEKRFVYTRYADDIIISSRFDFDCNQIQEYIIGALRNANAPFVLNTGKTRYGSSAGKNWNLGLMLNKDNQITIGFRKKKNFEAMCCNYIRDKRNGVMWDLHSVQVFAGLISYYRMVEKDYINYLIAHVNKKFGADIEAMIKKDLLT